MNIVDMECTAHAHNRILSVRNTMRWLCIVLFETTSSLSLRLAELRRRNKFCISETIDRDRAKRGPKQVDESLKKKKESKKKNGNNSNGNHTNRLFRGVFFFFACALLCNILNLYTCDGAHHMS